MSKRLVLYFVHFQLNLTNRDGKIPVLSANEKRLSCSIMDASTSRYASLIFRRTVEAGQEVMKIKISHVNGLAIVEGQPAPSDFSLPQGEFTLIKL